MSLAPPDVSAFPGIDPAWSRMVSARDRDGVVRTWHVLDTHAPDLSTPEALVEPTEPPVATLLCVHGNPTWSYLWRRFLAEAPTGWRVVAVDQLGMGWSDRTALPRRLNQRVDDLDVLTTALGVTGPVVTVAHDWGGPISLGWALAHRDQLAAVVLTNTAVDFADADLPPLIRLARNPALRTASCVTSPTFVRATTALSRPRLSKAVRDAFAAPYGDAARRQGVGDFVADIPLEADHPSRAAIEAIAEGVHTLDVPALFLWGPKDPVFTERYLRDLLDRMPQADVHRYAHASHLVTEDAPQTATDTWRWVQDRLAAPGALAPDSSAPGGLGLQRPEAAFEPDVPLWLAPTARAGDPATAVAELSGDARPVRVSFAGLDERVHRLAAGLRAVGVQPGQRVALLVPPGIDLTAAVYACWRIGAAIVVADAGLGFTSMGRALRGAGPDHVIAIGKGLAAVALLKVPGQRIAAGPLPEAARRALRCDHTLDELLTLGSVDLGDRADLSPGPSLDDEAAVLFTSGATGPAKGVVYRFAQLTAQLGVIKHGYGITADDRLVAAFAPFALYGPALGIGAAVPDMDVTAPGTLGAAALADAVLAVDATVVFASPAALRNVVATRSALTDAQTTALGGVRLVMSAGAPVPVSLLRAVQALVPAAELHTPYGMTEAMPVADVSLAEVEAAGPGDGVCVGRALPGVEVRISPLSPTGAADGELTVEPGVTGELCVRAAHVKDRYDRLWATERLSSRTPGWHRTGDVGHVDPEGRLWVEGRLVHVLSTADGPVTPVGVEQRVEELDAVRAAAVVGVGPAGTQQVVVVVVGEGEAPSRFRRPAVLAEPDLAAAVRTAAGRPIAAVLVTAALPVDIRHASKVDRAAVARWAERVLAGGRVGTP